MLSLKNKTRLFISYTRKDAELAVALNTALTGKGYVTFFDTESIEVGEPFPDRIITSIKKCDACIVIVSASSVTSEWCKLEAYYAHFYKKIIIPVKKDGGEYDLQSPLRYIQKDIHYAVIDSQAGAGKIINQIDRGLKAANRKAGKRLQKLLLIATAVITFIIAFFTLGARSINYLAYQNQKQQFIEEVKKSDKIYRTAEIELYRKKFNNDRELTGILHLQETDPGLTNIARINSKILSGALLRSFNMAQRQYYDKIDWKLSAIQHNLFTNATFSGGNISQVNFSDTRFLDVYFSGINGERKGVGLSANRFINCFFNTVNFDNTNCIDLQFKDCSFKGSFLNTTNFGAVIFYSDSTDNSIVITNGKLTSFENCIFENNNEPDPPGVMVLGKEEEMQFIGVVFEKCRFIGLVRPEWFKKCFFNDCIFPSGFDKNSIKYP